MGQNQSCRAHFEFCCKRSGVEGSGKSEQNQSQKERKEKYIVDEFTGRKRVMFFPKGLAIIWSEDQRYWRWSSLKETSGATVQVIELIDVCWLDVSGKFETSILTPGTLYEVAFTVMIKEESYGWEIPVNLQLVGPNGEVQEHKERLQDMSREQWTELHVGDFIAPTQRGRQIKFCLYEGDGGRWKRGLVIKGAIIRPKN